MNDSAVDWIFEIDEDFVINIRHHLPSDWNGDLTFSRNGGPRLAIHPDGNLRVFAGYAWDGCTPKLMFLDLAIGVPDGLPNERTRRPKAYYASLVHDALYQFLDDDLPLSRRRADEIFLELLARDGFFWRHLYYVVVRLLGGLFHRITSYKRGYHRSDQQALRTGL